MEIRGPSDDAADKIDAVVARVAEVQKAHPELYVGSFGESTNKALTASAGDDLKRAGLLSIPLTLIILLIAFGALIAAGIPLLLGLTSVAATLGLVALISQLLPMSGEVSAIILLIGLAVGVDYTMFYLKREREERAAGRSEEAALEAAAATSGRSVLVSGSTVLVAMAGMFFTADASFASFGVATMTVVAVAMLGSLTVLPALLSKLGDKVDRTGAVAPGARVGSGERSSIACFAAHSSRPWCPAGCSLRSPCPPTSSRPLSPASTPIRRSCWEPTTGSRRPSPARRTAASW
jgi:RND superfamily putative drug exporter